MKKSITTIILITFTIIFVNLLIALTTNAQSLGVVGKMYSTSDANQIYGKVTESITINSDLIRNVLDKAGDYIMFYFKNGKLKIFDAKRIELYPDTGSTIDPNETLRILSTSKVRELLLFEKTSTTNIEFRGKVFTITSGMNTLEFVLSCPPFCW